MTTQTERVDVLAVMDYHLFLMQNRVETARSIKGHTNRTIERDAAKEARAALAELIEALRGFVKLSEERKEELGELSTEMEARLVAGKAALARIGA